MNDIAELLPALRCLYNALLNIEEIDSQKQELLSKINIIDQQIEKERRKQRNPKASESNARKTSSAGMIIGIIASMIGLFIIFLFICLYAALLGGGWKAIYIIGFIFLLLAFGITFLISKTGKSSADEKAKKAVAKTHKDNALVQNSINSFIAQKNDLQDKQIPEVDARLIVAYQDVQPLIEAFPPNYCYSDAVGRVIFLLENQRADSIKEALNLYENELFQARMLEEQQRQTQATQISAKANIISAVSNVVTAFNTGHIASNTNKMVGSLRNIENYSAQTASNTASIARSSAATAASTAQIANYAGTIKNNL